jgi:electron transport complex protein RnfG
MRDILKLTLELTQIAAISAGLLAFVSVKTRPAREHAAETRRLDAVRKVLHIAEGETFRHDDEHDVYLVEKDGRVAKVAAESVSPHGYGGPVRIVVAADASGAIIDFAVVEASETPGLGAKIAGEGFISGLRGKTFDSDWRVRRDGGEIDAVTSATISSRAACEAVASAIPRLKTALSR